jgi:ElaB/YqjD/DUF883 family membrane-anchored ribosome-binding protein
MDQTQQNSKNGNPDQLAQSQAASGVARERLMEELKGAIGEAETWLDNSVKQGGEQLSEARSRFDDTLRTARIDLRKLEDSVMARGKVAAESAHVFVKDNPWKAVGLGAAIGVIAGMLISRK